MQRNEKAITHHVHNHLEETSLEKLSFMDLMHLWRYGSLSHRHLVDEERFWQIVRDKACAEKKP